MMPFTPPGSYDATASIDFQQDDWTCSGAALRWALRSLGLHPMRMSVEGVLIRRGLLTRADGLVDHTGQILVDLLREEFTRFGIWATRIEDADWGLFRNEAGAGPIVAYGYAWAHWAGVRTYDPADDTLILANSSPGWHQVDQVMTRQQFQALGPWNMVAIGRS